MLDILFYVIFLLQIALWFYIVVNGRGRLKTIALWSSILICISYSLYSVNAFKDRSFSVINHHDYFHYFIGAKYFNEIGYSRLYVCTAAAIDELRQANPERQFPELKFVRDLTKKNAFTMVSNISNDADCRHYFSAQRWRAFVHDVDRFLAVDGSTREWQGIVYDFGNNPPPTWYAVAHPLVDIIPFNGLTFHLIAMIDFIILVVAIPLIVFRCFGSLAAASYFIVLFGSALSNIYWVVGSYGRCLWLLFLCLGYAAFKRGWLVWAGLAFALASSMRIFPIVFPASLIVFLMLDRQTRGQAMNLAGSTLLWLVVLWLGSEFQWGMDRWRSFVDIIGVRLNMPAPPSVCLWKVLTVPFLSNLHSVKSFTDLNHWISHINTVYQTYRIEIGMTIIVLMALLIVRLRRFQEPMYASLLLSFFMMFFFMKPLTYYYIYLALALPLYQSKKDLVGSTGPFVALLALLGLSSVPILDVFGLRFGYYELTAYVSLIIFLFFVLYSLSGLSDLRLGVRGRSVA